MSCNVSSCWVPSKYESCVCHASLFNASVTYYWQLTQISVSRLACCLNFKMLDFSYFHSMLEFQKPVALWRYNHNDNKWMILKLLDINSKSGDGCNCTTMLCTSWSQFLFLWSPQSCTEGNPPPTPIPLPLVNPPPWKSPISQREETQNLPFVFPAQTCIYQSSHLTLAVAQKELFSFRSPSASIEGTCLSTKARSADKSCKFEWH